MEREREHKRNSVRTENRVHCLQSKSLEGVCDGVCVQPISILNLDYANVILYTRAKKFIENDFLKIYWHTIYCNKHLTLHKV